MQDSPNRAAIKKHKKTPTSLFQQLMPLWLLIGCLSWQPEANPIGRSVPVRSGEEEYFAHTRGTLGWVEKEKKKMFLSKAQCLGRTGRLLWHVQNSADKQGTGPLLLPIKEAVVLYHTAHHSTPSTSHSRGRSNQHDLRLDFYHFTIFRVFPQEVETKNLQRRKWAKR